MSQIVERPTFLLISGEGNDRSETNTKFQPCLVPLEKSKQAPPQQLALLGVAPARNTIVSVGMEGLDFTSFNGLLGRYAVRRVFDLRVAPSFRGNGFSIERVSEVFGVNRINYRRLTDVLNTPDEKPTNPGVRRQRYRTFLETKRDILLETRELALAGPSLVLGWEHPHAGSDRETFIEAIQSLGAASLPIMVVD